MKGLKLLLVPATGVFLAMFSGMASALPGAAVAVTDVTGTIDAQLPSISSVGLSVLGVIVAIAAYKWVKRAI
jgi:uncharacterized membrane protein